MRIALSDLFPVLFLVALAAGCRSVPTQGAADLASTPDLGRLPLNLTGKFASKLSLQLTIDSGAGPKPTTVDLLTDWAALQMEQQSALTTAWEMCSFPIPGLGEIPFPSLDSKLTVSMSATLSEPLDGATFVQPELAIVLGAHLADPAHEPLPTTAAKLCATAEVTGCVETDKTTGLPGILITPAANIAGLNGVDAITAVVRLRFSVNAIAHTIGTIDGTVSAASAPFPAPFYDWHILGCHLKGGGNCTNADIAQLENQKPKISFTAGTIRSQSQGFYFGCLQFLMDPESALKGSEPLPDGGALVDMGGA